MSSDRAKRPSLRKSLDIIPTEHEGERVFAVRDPLGLAKEPILVPGEILFLMSLMDGETTIADLQIEFTKKFGQLIMEDKVSGIAAQLDERGFLDSVRFREKVASMEKAFRTAASRESSHAGQAYPDDAKKLRALLDEIVPLDRPGGGLRPCGLVAPHIDIGRGRKVYGRAYAELARCEPPHTAVLLGTAHFAEGNIFILTDRDFASPLGTARADRDFCRTVAEAYPVDIRKGELAHRTEHSIEFQVLFLQHLFGDRMPRIVPLLGTAFEAAGEEFEAPSDLAEVRGLLDGLKRATEACPGDLLFVAGADLCHAGPRFGAPHSLSADDLERIEKEDRQTLEAGAAKGANAFYREVSEIGNRNNICSAVSLYTMVALFEDRKASLLDYDTALEPDGQAAVGFSAMRFD